MGIFLRYVKKTYLLQYFVKEVIETNLKLKGDRKCIFIIAAFGLKSRFTSS
jgi:hypothetical protein